MNRSLRQTARYRIELGVSEVKRLASLPANQTPGSARWIPLGILTVFWLTANIKADEQVEYNRDIRPILAENCFACHGGDESTREAGLRLDLRDEAIDSGAITEGEPDASELVARIDADDVDLIMPPVDSKKILTDDQKKKLKLWIKQGAKYQTHWSFVPPRSPPVPSVENEGWIKNEIDRFVLSRLEREGLTPAPGLNLRALFRRISLDTTGLPPTPDDAIAFENDYQRRGDSALSDWIDRLMESSAYGEHRARYWLDAARYGDTHGLHFDNYREMWPYRDWVIRSFNANQPFDEFTVEQIAGDLLPNPTDSQLVATGFQRCNISTNEGGTIDEENLANYAADRVQTFGWVFLGLTTNCAQCHDHKFDPFTMEDYYSMAAFFRNTTQKAKDGNVKDGRGPVIVVPSEEDALKWKSLPDEIAKAKSQRELRRKQARNEFDRWLVSAKPELLDEDIPTDDLVVHVPLNEGAGNLANNLCSSPTAFKSTGDVSWSAEGKLGPAPVMKLGGTFELGELGNFRRDQKFSYGAWIKAGRNGVFGGIIARMDEKASYRGWDLWQNDQSVSVHLVDNWPASAIKVTTKRNVLDPKKWQHVFVTYDGSGKPAGIRIYVNGKQEKLKVDTNTLKPDASIQTETSLRVGQRSHTQVFDGGSVQDVRVYQRSLEAAEVKTLSDIVPLQVLLAKGAEVRTPQQHNALYDHYLVTRDSKFIAFSKAVADLEGEFEAIKSRSPVTHIQRERSDSKPMAHILMRGAYDSPGAEVSAATPAALHPMDEQAPRNRLGLARWVVDPANPLTTRVTVNRFWQELFGQGIVTTPEDFGIMGSAPSHPELLDWLAVEFRENSWDVQHLLKLMLMSATYRQAAISTKEKLEKDPGNRLFSRGPRFRMDAEMVRDYALATSGLLSAKMYGPGTKPYQPENLWDIVGLPGGNTRNYVQDNGENLYRRTIYSFWKRMAPPPNLESFNAPSREICTVARERTNTPLQALVTLNDPQFVEAARVLAQTAILAGNGDDLTTIDFIGQRVLCRPISEQELKILLASKRELLRFYQSETSEAEALITVGESAADRNLDVANLAAWSMICNQVLNLDEVLNK